MNNNLKQKAEAFAMAAALEKILAEQQKKVRLENEAAKVRKEIHGTYPLCGGGVSMDKKDRFAYSKTEL